MKTLHDLVQKRVVLSEREARYFMGQLFEAVNYLHVDEGVMHKDLKLSNVFLSKDLEVKIGDFGLAERVKG